MGPTKLGHYQYVIWVAMMTGTVAALGVPAATRKFVAEYLGRGEHGAARAIIRATLRFQIGVAVVVAVVGSGHRDDLRRRPSAAPGRRWRS